MRDEHGGSARVEWNDFQIFLAIARAGSLARAAEKVGLDPTTMGRHLRRLETRLNATLFERSRDGQVPTEAGEALLEAVEAMAQVASQISENASVHEGPTGAVRLSVSEGFGTWFVSRHVPSFAATYPGLTLDLIASSGFLNPSRREADIAVMLSRPKSGPLMTRKLSDYALQVYASEDYLNQHGMPKTAADLARNHRLVGYVPDLIYSPELRYLSELAPNLTATIRCSSINAQLRLVTEGAGVGVLPRFMADANPGLVPILPQNRIVRSFWLVTHQGTHKLARIKATRDWLIDVVARNRASLIPDDI